MENCKIAIIEDSSDHILFARHRLEKEGHSVIAEAANLFAALILLDQIDQGLSCDAILLDGNLSAGRKDYQDAREINDRYKELGLKVPIIGYSSGSLADLGIVKEDFDTKKNIDKMIRIVNSL